MITRIALALLGLYALAFVLAGARKSKSDAAGQGLAKAYLAIGMMIWLLMAGLTALGIWTPARFLVYTPFVPLLFPVLLLGEGILKLFGRLQSKPRQLARAVRQGNVARTKALLSGMTVGDWRPFLHAALNGRYARDVVPLLLQAGAPPDDPAVLAKALKSNTTSLVPFLERGANPNTLLPNGEPVLFAALDGGWTEDVIALVKAGADLTVRDRAGWTPLLAHATGRRGFGPGNWIGVHELLKAGADPKVAGPDGTTIADLFAKMPPFQIHPERIEDLRKRING
ncbi:MAG: ankyrin repeat domain-containing protein [Planctomycetota bacterium]|nr:MAG: ankyrin repeat domain-containing protein [Planctomycetota bacterium]